MTSTLFSLRDFFVHRFDLERKSIVAALAWGFWVLARQSFDSAPGFHFLNVSAAWFGLAGETFWGGLLLLGGTLQLLGLLTNRDRLRMCAAMWLCAAWSLIGWQFFLWNPRTTGAPTYLIFAWSAGCLYFQIGTHRR